MARIELHLTDGTVLDLTGLTVAEVFAKIAACGVTREQIRETRHIVETTALPQYRCPRCGRVSYNRHDVAERYCGACHQFEEPERP